MIFTPRHCGGNLRHKSAGEPGPAARDCDIRGHFSSVTISRTHPRTLFAALLALPSSWRASYYTVRLDDPKRA
jgi:hypothetical protein